MHGFLLKIEFTLKVCLGVGHAKDIDGKEYHHEAK